MTVRNEVYTRSAFAKAKGIEYFEKMMNAHKAKYNIMASVYTDKLAQARRICVHYAREYMKSCGC